jgi:hypothetical protein
MKNNSLLRAVCAVFLLCAMPYVSFAQAIRDGGLNAPRQSEGEIPLKRVVILTSGLAYYEHSGSIDGPTKIALPFRPDAVNDALKSLVINDPSSANPSISYPSEQMLLQTLRTLKINLSDDPSLAVILERLKGEEVTISEYSTERTAIQARLRNGELISPSFPSPSTLTGRITGIEYRPILSQTEPWLLLNTKEGLKSFSLSDITSISFNDPDIEKDLNRALDLLASSRNSFSRQLTLSLPGNGRRAVSLSYIIPSPVWKVSYRLDLGASKPIFQGWAIVDNDSDSDWKNVELSLVAGRPVSFIQNLYPPYYVWRPVQPLSIAGTAAASSHDSGFTAQNDSAKVTMEAPMPSASASRAENLYGFAYDDLSVERGRLRSSENVASGAIDTASGSDAGGQFEFTIKTPVSLDRRMSAMLPLVESAIGAKKVIIFNGGKNPRLGAELTNTSGMKLPAGAVTVYDGGVYAGDALLDFWNEDEKRLISFGDDLSVTVLTSETSSRTVSTVTVSGGVMTITRSISYIKTYTFKNSASASKQLVLEHPKTSQTTLVSPEADEQTQSAYRFTMTLGANRDLLVTVNEQRPISETVSLLSIQPSAFLSYTTNQEIPSRVRDALRRAVELRQAADTADATVKELETQKTRLAGDQDRIRRNLEAAGNQTQQGQEYLKRLVALDGEIDALAPVLEKAYNDAKTARQAWENYLRGLNL